MADKQEQLENSSRTLVYGIGNPLRRDDGIGIDFVTRLKNDTEHKSAIEYEENYQLNAEDSLLISEYDYVYFVDASKNSLDKGFEIKPVTPTNEIQFSTHAMSPSTILALCQDLYKVTPKVFLVEIQGHTWGIGQGLSQQAEENLACALKELKSCMNFHC